MAKEVVLTGLRSNAEFHIGNYLGAILPMVELQKKHAGQYQLNMFIPDLHSFTTPIDHGTLYEQSLENLKVFIAAGLDIDQSDTFIYRQSYIPAHSEMTWVLNCFTGFDELSRMTEFKEKSRLLYKQNSDYYNDELGHGRMWDYSVMKQKQAEVFSRIQANVSAGLFNYPILMAADILLYGAKWVPVGEDQRQHVEFTRDLAIRMNNKFGDLFVVPEENKKQIEFAGRKEPVRIRSLRNPEKKMSKSIEDPAGTIMLSDKPEEAAKKIMGATTDSLAKSLGDIDSATQPGVHNLLTLLDLLKGFQKETPPIGNTQGYEYLKKAVAEAVKNFLTDLQTKLAQVDSQKLMSKLEEDEAAMSKIANETLLKVQKAVGLRPAK